MEFQGTINANGQQITDVIGNLDPNGQSGRFVLKAGESIALGNCTLQIGHAQYSISVVSVIGSSSKPQGFEFVCKDLPLLLN